MEEIRRKGPLTARSGEALSVAARSILIALASGLCTETYAGENSRGRTLEECRRLQVEIVHYEDLRRDGGSGRQMDDWKRARRKKESEFRALGCHYRYHEL